MKRKRYSEEQIISILKEHEAGASVPDLTPRHGVVENTTITSDHTAPRARNRPRYSRMKWPDTLEIPHQTWPTSRGAASSTSVALETFFPCVLFVTWLIKWSHCAESNRGPTDYESVALPTELQWPEVRDAQL